MTKTQTKLKKVVKKTVKETSRKKTASDELYNARRRAIRQASRLEKQAEKLSGWEKRGALEKAKALRETAEKTKASNIKSFEERQKYASSLNAVTQKDYNTKRTRTNIKFQKALNTAGEAGGLSNITAADAHIFYASTRHLWEGAPIEARNDLIMLKMGTGSLKEAFNKVMQLNEDARKKSRGLLASQETSDNEFYNGEDNTLDSVGSPDYVDVIKFI